MNDRFVLSWERHAVMLLLDESDQPFPMKFPKRIQSRFSIVGLVIEPHSYVIFLNLFVSLRYQQSGCPAFDFLTFSFVLSLFSQSRI